MGRSALGRSLSAAFLLGGLGYGGALGVAHLLYNRLGHLGDALVLFSTMALLYGGWAVACVLVAALAEGLVPPLLRRAAGSDPGLRRGLALFQAIFWAGYFLYGLTYDQGPFGPLESRTAMLAWVGTILIATTAGAAAASLAVAPLVARLASSPRGIGAAAGVVIAAHLGTALWLGLSATAQGPAAAGIEPSAREGGADVVLVGLDGATWRVLQPMIDRGELPAFAAMQRRGTWGELATYPDSNSAVIWASIYTGLDRAEHRLLDFYTIRLPLLSPPGIYPVHRTFFKELAGALEAVGLADRRPVHRFSLRRGAPLWEIADAMALSVGVVDGYFYSQPAPTLTSPESWLLAYGLDLFANQLRNDGSAQRRADLPLFVQPEGDAEALFAVAEPHLPQWDFHWQSETLLDLLASRPRPRFVNLYTHQPDAVQHLEWKWFEPRYFLGVDEQETARRRDEIPAMMRAFDDFLGRLREEVGEDTVIIVASDHGHSPTLLHQSYFTQHRHGPPGILLMAGGPVTAGRRLDSAHVLDVFPTILALLGLPLPDDADGRLLDEAIDGGFLRRLRPLSIPSYAPYVARSGDGSGIGLEAEEMGKLEALGYL